MTTNIILLIAAAVFFALVAIVGAVWLIRSTRAQRAPYAPLKHEPKHRRF